MKRILLLAALTALAGQAGAQQSLLTASPIPEGAEKRFCYYAGLAYSVNSYILVGSEHQVVQFSANSGAGASEAGGALNTGSQLARGTEQKPLQCVVGTDGVLGWTAVATIQIAK